MEWQPATLDYVKAIMQQDLAKCNAAQVDAFQRFAVEPYTVQLIRYGKLETVIVVARNGSEVMYWEDVEEGFNISRLSSDGMILEHFCNQDDLGIALLQWVGHLGEGSKVVEGYPC